MLDLHAEKYSPLVPRGVTYGSCALLVWDYFLTLDDEVVGHLHRPHTTLLTPISQLTYIWRSPRSIVKYLFIGNRYINLFTQPFSLAQIAGTLPLDSTAVRDGVRVDRLLWLMIGGLIGVSCLFVGVCALRTVVLWLRASYVSS